MKKILLILVMGIVSCNVFSQGEKISFRVKAGSEYINMGSYSAPVFYDFDKDGIKDLILGEFSGKIRFYKNIGTKRKPEFKDFSYIKANGQDIVVPNY